MDQNLTQVDKSIPNGLDIQKFPIWPRLHVPGPKQFADVQVD